MNYRLKILLSTIILPAALMTSCKKNSSTFTPACDGTTPTYDNYVAGVIASKCSGCHGPGSSDGDYSTYAGISTITSNGKFEKEVLTDQTMPDNGTISEADLNKLKCWVDNGFPEN